MQDPVGVYAAYYVTHSDVCPDLDLMCSIRYSLIYTGISGSISHAQHTLLISSYVFPDLVYPDLECPDPYAPPSCAVSQAYSQHNDSDLHLDPCHQALLTLRPTPYRAVSEAYSQRTEPLQPGGALMLGGEQV